MVTLPGAVDPMLPWAAGAGCLGDGEHALEDSLRVDCNHQKHGLQKLDALMTVSMCCMDNESILAAEDIASMMMSMRCITGCGWTATRMLLAETHRVRGTRKEGGGGGGGEDRAIIQ